jgi:hypothetical protein
MSDVLRDSSGVLRRHLLTMQLDRAGRGFALAAARLGDHAKLIALLEGELAVPKGQCDRHRARSSSRELAAKVALDKLAAFRPRWPLLSEEATEQSCATLMEASE